MDGRDIPFAGNCGSCHQPGRECLLLPLVDDCSHSLLDHPQHRLVVYRRNRRQPPAAAGPSAPGFLPGDPPGPPADGSGYRRRPAHPPGFWTGLLHRRDNPAAPAGAFGPSEYHQQPVRERRPGAAAPHRAAGHIILLLGVGDGFEPALHSAHRH